MGGGGLHSTPPDSAPSIAAISGGTGKGKRGGGLSALLFRGGSLAPTHRCGRPGRGAGGARGGGGGERWVGWSGSGERGGRERKGLPAWPPSAPAGCRMAQLYGRGASTPRHRPQICFPHPAMGNGHSSPPQGGYGQGVREEGGGGAIVGLGSAAGRAWVGGSFGVCVSPTPVCLGGGWSVLSCDVSGFVGALGGTGPSWASRWGWGFVAGGCHWGAGGGLLPPPPDSCQMLTSWGGRSSPCTPRTPHQVLAAGGGDRTKWGGASAPPQHPNSTRRWQLGGALV